MIQNYLKAGYPALSVLTYEPHRAEQLLPCDGWRFIAWDCIQGIRELNSKKRVDDVRDPVEALRFLGGLQDTVMLAHNLHLFMDVPEVIQAIQNGVSRWKGCGNALVMISPTIEMRPEIQKFFHVIDLPLPDGEELYALQADLGNHTGVAPDYSTISAAKGLTEYEAETAFAYSLIKEGCFSSRVITNVKGQMIRKSGLMEFWSPADINDVGGLDNLKTFIQNRAEAFIPGKTHLPRPRGLLLVGISGTGKSLSAKATASILGFPLIRLDISSLKGSLVGESERKMREATNIIDAFGNCVVWCDEIEKALAGSRSSGENDGGTSAAMLGHVLTWMQETNSPVFIMATANDISKLPPELIRRFDATFFVDLPSKMEILDIIRIMNRKWNSVIPDWYADKLSGYTGAEIEQLAKDSLFDGLEPAFDAIVPLSKSMKEGVQALREWASTRCRIANYSDEQFMAHRKIRHIK